jgi:hypothetical protein
MERGRLGGGVVRDICMLYFLVNFVHCKPFLGMLFITGFITVCIEGQKRIFFSNASRFMH